MKQILFKIFLCACLLPNLSFAQINISGVLYNEVDTLPVPYATVYINGTSNGSITDANGVFHLSDVEAPAQLVVSHLSYETKVKNIYTYTDQSLRILLKSKSVVINQVDVGAMDNRSDNIARFKRGYLGNDYWGKESILLNDSVLVFKKTYQKDTCILVGDSTTIGPPKESQFEVTANAPLVVDLPKLGYTLYIDLIYYNEVPTRTTGYGYHYYKPYELEGWNKSRKIIKNRQKAYYNSAQHFFRALSSNSLKEQGFIVQMDNFDKNGRRNQNSVNIDTCIVPVSESEMALIGLKDKTYSIEYFYNYKGAPQSVKQTLNYEQLSRSQLYIYQDSCAFYKDGIIPGNGLSIKGPMAQKRIAATLPRYYDVDAK